MSTPAALYRNAIDLNRYSNSVARRVMNAYNDIIIDAANQLRTIDELTAPVKAARLRSILAQLKESLAGWAGNATEITALELQGLTELQSEFVTEQLRKVLPAGSRDAVRTVEISPQLRSRWLPRIQRSSMWWRYRMTCLRRCTDPRR
jgi:hypothetical protein